MTDLTLEPDPSPSTDGLLTRLRERRFLGEYADRDAAHAAAVALVERIGPRSRLLEVRVGDERRGQVWLTRQGDDLAVVDVTLEDHGLAAGVRDALLALARDEEASRLTVTVSPGDLGAERLVEGGGFETFATQMRLDLDHELPGEDVVRLEPMAGDGFDEWLELQIEEYAEARIKSGEAPERARELSRQQHAELLPDGLATEHHHLFAAHVDDAVVGTLWLGTERPMVFVYDVVVDEEHRGQGYGGGLMRAADLWAQARGAHAIGLNVFGYNRAARGLYDKLGYHVTENFVARTP